MMKNERLEAAFRAAVAPYPLLEAELDGLLPALGVEERYYLKVVYAGLGVQDLTGVPPETLLGDVRAALLARRELRYAAAVSEELFNIYVLPPRVNNEHLDGSRGWLYSQLRERVRERNMLSAALEVNCWCCERAAYLPTDDRTIGPLGMCRRTRGRCGEESTLAVAALRAAGIPARQVYAPRWAHCDDNHAWVEFWAEGQWHYLGACEPEPVPDRGWFTSAASRAMLVRAIAPAPGTERGYAVVNTTARYGDTARLTVRVRAGGAARPGVPVRFQLVNDSQVHTIYESVAGASGEAAFETGLGDLVVSAWFDGRLVERRVDVRREQTVFLDWETGFDPLTEERTERWELVPPAERIPAPAEEDAAHTERLRRCEQMRQAYEDTFRTGSRWLKLAAGNWAELDRFLASEEFDPADQELLLETLSEKDFADVTCETLTDFLRGALPWRESYPRSVWRDWLLAPRVEHEMLLPVRHRLAAALAGETLPGGEAVLAWMEEHLRPVEADGLSGRRGSAAGYLRHGVCPRGVWALMAVQLCRALGLPARLDPVTGLVQTWSEGGGVRTLGLQGRPVRLTLDPAGETVRCREHFSLSRWENGDYRPLGLDGSILAGPLELLLPSGAYSLVTARRQIDGSVSVRAERFLLTENRRAAVRLEPDRTREKLKKAALPTVLGQRVSDGAAVELTARTEKGRLLIFAQPGMEPTEHLLQELLELREDYNRGGWPVDILLSPSAEAENATLRRVLESLRHAACYRAGEKLRYPVRLAMGVGDARLPLAVVLDREGNGVCACANYHIRSAAALLRILRMGGKEHVSV